MMRAMHEYSAPAGSRPMGPKAGQEATRPALVVTIERKATREPATRKSTRGSSRGR